MPNMEELISRISRKPADAPAEENYAYSQLKLSRRTIDFCIFAVTGDIFTGHYRFLKRFYGLADIPTMFQERIE